MFVVLKQGYFVIYFRIVLRFIKNAISNNKYPFFLTVLLTSKCSRINECHYCWRPKNSLIDNEISMSTIDEILKYRVPIILLSGGEPTEHSDFSNIVKRFESMNVKLCILTNGDNCDLLKESIANRSMTRVLLSINQYDSQERIFKVKENVHYLKINGITTYINIPIDSEFFDFSFFTTNVIELMRLANRIYITPYTKEKCELGKKQYDVMKRCGIYIRNTLKIKNILVTKPIPKLQLYLCKMFSWIIGETFDICSGFPFRATVNENGTIIKCIKKAE